MGYVGEFHCGTLNGRGEFWLNNGAKRFDGEWEKGWTRRGTAVDSDGSTFRVAFKGRGVPCINLERAFVDKQSYRDDEWGCPGASWTRLPVRRERTHGVSQV
jgi:hypothetical protein